MSITLSKLQGYRIESDPEFMEQARKINGLNLKDERKAMKNKVDAKYKCLYCDAMGDYHNCFVCVEHFIEL